MSVRYTQEQVDEIRRLRALGLPWRAVGEKAGVNHNTARVLYLHGIRPRKKPRAYPAGSRSDLEVDGEIRTLRQWAQRWLKKHRPEVERNDGEIRKVLHVLRRRIQRDWPPRLAVDAPPTYRPDIQSAYEPPDPEHAVLILGPPVLPPPDEAAMQALRLNLAEVV